MTPTETLSAITTAAVKKSTATIRHLIIFGLFAGMFIAFAAAASTLASMNLLSNPETFGLGRLVSGAVFVGGLALVVFTGAELFTGNSLMFAGLLGKKITPDQLLRNWCIVLVANLVGASLVAFLLSTTGLFTTGAYGAVAIKIAAGKTALDFIPALISGILCNFLVCLAVWLATGSKTTGTKLVAIFFPIFFFIILGFEHSIANAFYIPAGLLASTDPALASAATDIGANLTTLQPIGLFTNIIPVLLGNIIGGTLLATAFHFTLSRRRVR